jgi:hypothetical protein
MYAKKLLKGRRDSRQDVGSVTRNVLEKATKMFPNQPMCSSTRVMFLSTLIYFSKIN